MGGRGGTIGRNSTDIYTAPCVQWLASESCWGRELSSVLYCDLEVGRGKGRCKEVRRREYMGKATVADSFIVPAEANALSQQLYSNEKEMEQIAKPRVYTNKTTSKH